MLLIDSSGGMAYTVPAPPTLEARDVPPTISADDHAEGLGVSLRQLAGHVAAGDP